MVTENTQIDTQITAQKILTDADNGLDFSTGTKPVPAQHVPYGQEFDTPDLQAAGEVAQLPQPKNTLADKFRRASFAYEVEQKQDFLETAIPTAQAAEGEQPQPSIAGGPIQEPSENPLANYEEPQSLSGITAAKTVAAINAPPPEEPEPKWSPIEFDQEAMRNAFNTDPGPQSTLSAGTANAEIKRPEPVLTEGADGPEPLELKGAPRTLMDIADEGDRLNLIHEEMNNYANGVMSFLTPVFQLLDYVFAPAMAPLAAVMAPVAYHESTGSFMSDLNSIVGIAGDAANERLLRWFDPVTSGEFMPDYGTEIVKRYLPGIPEEYQQAAGITLEMLVSIPVSLGMAGAMQRAVANSAIRTGEQWDGLLKEAVRSYLGWNPAQRGLSQSTQAILKQIDDGREPREVLEEMLQLEEAASGGDRAAFMKLNKMMEEAGSEVIDTEKALEMMEQMVGKPEGTQIIYREFDNTDMVRGEFNERLDEALKRAQGAEEGLVDQALTIQRLEETIAKNEIRFNLTNINGLEDFDAVVEEAIGTVAAQNIKQLGKPLPKEAPVWYHGGSGDFAEDIAAKGFQTPSFFTKSVKGAEWFARERGEGSPAIYPVRIDPGKGLNPYNPEDVTILRGVLDELGIKYEMDGAFIWDVPDIARHSPYDGSNVFDLVYIPEVREKLKAAGYDSFHGYDILERGEIETIVPFSNSQIQSYFQKGATNQTHFDLTGKVVHGLRYEDDAMGIFDEGLRPGTNVARGEDAQSFMSQIVYYYDEADLKFSEKDYRNTEGVISTNTGAKPKGALINLDELAEPTNQARIDQWLNKYETSSETFESMWAASGVSKQARTDIEKYLAHLDMTFREKQGLEDIIEGHRLKALEHLGGDAEALRRFEVEQRNLDEAYKGVERAGGFNEKVIPDYNTQIEELVRKLPEELPVYTYRTTEDGVFVDPVLIRPGHEQIDPKAGFRSMTQDQMVEEAMALNKSMQELYGVPVERMTMEETLAMKKLTMASMNQLMEYRSVMLKPEVNEATRIMAKAAFTKQLMVHHLIMSRVTGSKSYTGQKLHAARQDVERKLMMANFKECN